MKYRANNNPTELESSFRPKNILAKQRVSTQYVPPLTDGSLDTYAYLFRRGAECVVQSIVALGKTFSSTASAAALQFDPWVTYDRSIMTAHAYHLSHAHAKEPVKKTVSPGRTGITLPLSAKFSSGHQ